MTFIAWDDKLATDIFVIDEEHKFLIENLNVLFDVCNDEAQPLDEKDSLIRAVLSNLAHYTHTHFVVEEEMMRVFHYPDMDAHKAEHTSFVEKVAYLNSSVKEGGMDLSNSLLNFLKEWLTKHILGTDARMASYLREKGQN
ncbi:MAG: bacteriohemerythrin [bacterium]|nr:bacteriohemerythrin [bacterium]